VRWYLRFGLSYREVEDLVIDDPILMAGVEARLADVYLAHPSGALTQVSDPVMGSLSCGDAGAARDSNPNRQIRGLGGGRNARRR
jgi:hypothetical protein